MSSHYKYQRDVVIAGYYITFAIFMAISYYCAIICSIVPFYTFQLCTNGKAIDIWTTGYVIYVSIIFFSHGMFWCFIKDITKLTVYLTLMIFGTLPFISIIIHLSPKSEPSLYQVVLSEIFPDLAFWLTVLITTTLMLLPVIFYRIIRDLILYPQFNQE